MKILVILLLIPVIRGVIFFFDWLYMLKVCKKHKQYLSGIGENDSQQDKALSSSAGEWITENISEIKSKVKKAGIDNPIHSFMDAQGYGYVGQKSISTLDNLLYLNETIQHNAVTILKRARGYFKVEAIKSINPIYWLETLFFLPKAIVSASGIDTSSKLVDIGLKITQIVYWVVILGAVIINPSLITNLIDALQT